MSHRALAEFLEELSRRGELVRVSAEVDPALEAAEITRRVAAAGGPALLFERVRGSAVPLVTNLLGSEARACQALGVESLDEIPARCESLIREHTPQNWFDRLKMSAEESGAHKFRPKTVKSGPCQQVVRLGRDVDLAAFPLLKSWPGESGPSITSGQLITRDRATAARGVTLCPLQVTGTNTLAILDDGHAAFARHWSSHRAAGEKLAAALVVAGGPALLVAASLELPEEIDALHAAGLLAGEPLELVKCRTHELEVPAGADFIFEGYVDPETPPVAVEAAGAGGSHYRPSRPAPVFHVTAVTHRAHGIFTAIVDDGAGGERGVLYKARERMLLPAVRAAAPDVVDLHLPAFGGPHRYAFVSMRKRYPFHARQVAAALWGTDALKFTRILVLVDAEVDVHDVPAVLTAVGAQAAADRDAFWHDGPAYGPDAAGDAALLERHLAIDATAKVPGERQAASAARLEAGEAVRKLVSERWAEYKVDLGK